MAIPTVPIGSFGLIAMDLRVGAVTVSVPLAGQFVTLRHEVRLAEIFTWPRATPVAIPVDALIVAVAALAELQATPGAGCCVVPSLYVAFAWNVAVSPVPVDCAIGTTS